MISWTISSSILIAVVVVLRRVLRGRVDLRLQYTLWALVLLRLLIPVSLGESSVSVMNAIPESAPGVILDSIFSAGIPEDAYTADHATNGHAAPDASYAAEQVQPDGVYNDAVSDVIVRTTDWGRVVTNVWIAGIAVVGLWLLITNLYFFGSLKRSRRPLEAGECPLPVFVTQAVATPCLFGLFRPAIYVTPEALGDATTLRHVLEHEATHFRHGDHIWSSLRGVCLALHWYNPLVWWAAFLSTRDAELSCDDTTIKRIGEESRVEYGRTLVGLTCTRHSAGQLLIAATTMTGGKKSIRERIRLIANKPKMTAATLAIVIVVALTAAGCTFTGAKDEDEGFAPDTVSITQLLSSYYLQPVVNPDTVSYFYEKYESISQSEKAEDADWAWSLCITFTDSDSGDTRYWEISKNGEVRFEFGGDGYTVENGAALYSVLLEKYEQLTQAEPDRQEEIGAHGFSVRPEGTYSYDDVAQLWAELYLQQYKEALAGSPVLSSDAALLSYSMQAESLISSPKTIIYNLTFACSASDAEAFEGWFAGWASQLDGREYPEYAGWMSFGFTATLVMSEDGSWLCTETGSGGYGGWGYLNYEEEGVFGAHLQEAIDGQSSTPENVIRSLPFADWSLFNTQWGSEGWNVLWKLLDDHCLTEGQVYGPEDTRMWSDVYPDDQIFRNLYVMKAALNTDGAYSEGIADILRKQHDYDEAAFSAALGQLPEGDGDIIFMLLSITYY